MSKATALLGKVEETRSEVSEGLLKKPLMDQVFKAIIAAAVDKAERFYGEVDNDGINDFAPEFVEALAKELKDGMREAVKNRKK